MTDTIEFLLRSMEENQKHAHLSENRRATLANVVLVIVSAIHVVLALVGFSRRALPLTVLLVLLGVYGLLVSVKLYERQQFHLLRARMLRKQLDELCPQAQVLQVQKLAEEEHKTHYSLFFKVRLNNIWLGLYTVIAVLGIVYTVICLI